MKTEVMIRQIYADESESFIRQSTNDIGYGVLGRTLYAALPKTAWSIAVLSEAIVCLVERVNLYGESIDTESIIRLADAAQHIKDLYAQCVRDTQKQKKRRTRKRRQQATENN